MRLRRGVFNAPMGVAAEIPNREISSLIFEASNWNINGILRPVPDSIVRGAENHRMPTVFARRFGENFRSVSVTASPGGCDPRSLSRM